MIDEAKRRVAYINEMIESGHAKELVAEGERYHEDQLARIAQNICSRTGNKDIGRKQLRATHIGDFWKPLKDILLYHVWFTNRENADVS